MIAVQIPDTRKFLADLFLHDTFDTFVLSEALITTFTTFRIDGSWHPEYFAPEKTEVSPGPDTLPDASAIKEETPSRMMSWGRLRPVALHMVKGKHSPVFFRIILKLSDNASAKIASREEVTVPSSQIGGLFLNIVYQDRKVTCTSGTSLKTFTPDRSLDHVWDNLVVKFFDTSGIRTKIL